MRRIRDTPDVTNVIAPARRSHAPPAQSNAEGPAHGGVYPRVAGVDDVLGRILARAVSARRGRAPAPSFDRAGILPPDAPACNAASSKQPPTTAMLQRVTLEGRATLGTGALDYSLTTIMGDEGATITVGGDMATLDPPPLMVTATISSPEQLVESVAIGFIQNVSTPTPIEIDYVGPDGDVVVYGIRIKNGPLLDSSVDAPPPYYSGDAVDVLDAGDEDEAQHVITVRIMDLPNKAVPAFIDSPDDQRYKPDFSSLCGTISFSYYLVAAPVTALSNRQVIASGSYGFDWGTNMTNEGAAAAQFVQHGPFANASTEFYAKRGEVELYSGLVADVSADDDEMV